jgi:hypothetical protein
VIIRSLAPDGYNWACRQSGSSSPHRRRDVNRRAPIEAIIAHVSFSPIGDFLKIADAWERANDRMQRGACFAAFNVDGHPKRRGNGATDCFKLRNIRASGFGRQRIT